MIDLIKNSSSYTRVNTLLKELKKTVRRMVDTSMEDTLINLVYTLFRDAPLWIKNATYKLLNSLIENDSDYIQKFNKLGGCKLMVDQLKSITYIHNVSQVEHYITNMIAYLEYCSLNVIEVSFLNNGGIDIFSNIYILSTDYDLKNEILTFISQLICENNEYRYIRDELRENGMLNHLLDNLIRGCTSMRESDTYYEEDLFRNIYCIIHNNSENIEYCREVNLINYLRNVQSSWDIEDEIDYIIEY